MHTVQYNAILKTNHNIAVFKTQTQKSFTQWDILRYSNQDSIILILQ